MKHKYLTAIGCLLLLLDAADSARAATYNVGPAPGQIPQLAGVPWGGLQPGDVVNIHPIPGGYREIIQISAAGTAAQPITIRGIPDPVTGALPVIDGDGAVMDSHVDFRNPVFENFGLLIVTPRKTGYVYGQTFPAWINIESLAIRNAMYRADGSIRFGAYNGVAQYPALHRGTLHFFHNTVVNHQTGVVAFSLTDPAYSGTNAIFERVDARNNVFFTDTTINANIWKAFCLIATPASPIVDLGMNWVSPGTLKYSTSHPSGAIINGWGNLIVGDAAGKNIPGFAHLAGGDYHLTSSADSIDAAGPLSAPALALGHAVTEEYVLNWSSAAAGRYQVVAKAYDRLNACSVSPPLFVVVQ